MRISMRPGLPGLAVTAQGITGDFELALGPDDRPDLRHPITGRFAMAVANLSVGPASLSRLARSLLSRGDEVPVHGEIRDTVRAGGHDEDDFRFVIDITLLGASDTIEGEGRTGIAGPDGLRVEGLTRIDARRLGIPVPLGGRVRTIAEWDLWLVR